MENNECIFCKIISKTLDSNIVYEDDLICCFLDIEPINEGHVLIVPKKHKHNIDEIDDEVLSTMMNLLKQISIIFKNVYSCQGYTIMQNGGDFTDFRHFHIHIFPRYKDDGFNWICKEENNINNQEFVRDILKENLNLIQSN